MSSVLSVDDGENLVVATEVETLVSETTRVDTVVLASDETVVDVVEDSRVVVGSPDEVLLEQVESTALVVSAEQGPPGPIGSVFIQYPAAQAIGGHRAVYLTEASQCDYADQSDRVKSYQLLGVTIGAVQAGSNARIQTSGLLIEPSWSWAVGEFVYLGGNGLLTQTAPTSGYLVIIGLAASATGLLISIKPPIKVF